MSNQRQPVLSRATAFREASSPITQAMSTALALFAAGTLLGCTADALPSEADADLLGASSSSEETLGSTAQAVVGPILDSDSVKVTGNKVDFGGALWGIHSPVGSGTMTWRVVDGFYTPRLTGNLHLEDADGQFARMHVSYWGGDGSLIATRHGGVVQAVGNGHQSWSVDLSPITPSQIVEAHVCTELSDDGVDFPQVACETYIMN